MRVDPRVCRFRATLLAAVFLLYGGIAASAAPYGLDAKAKNRVEFHSKATLESFSGKAKGIRAEFDVDPVALHSTKGKVTVDLRTLDTGIDLRNKHMRENHLHTDSFPNAVFELDSVAGTGTSTPNAPEVLVLHGSMTIHGITKEISTPATITGLGSDAIRVQAEFPLKITEYGVPRPEFLFLKLAEEVRIVVDLTLSPTVK
jgi:polyisoprenoid-binding protein YceI